MAFNFSKIVRSVEKASNTIAQVESLTRAASNFNTGIPLKLDATFPTANSLGIRQSIGSFDNVISANSFSQTNLSNSVTAAFNPEALNSLVSSPGDVGNTAANMDLGKRRANMIKDYLISEGVAASKIVADSQGESLPIASNNTLEGRGKNRRTELQIID